MPEKLSKQSLTGRYQVLGEIGRGGMGKVLRGRDSTLGRDLAIKVLLEQYAGQPEAVQRFREEAQIGGQLQHPGAVPVYELGVSGKGTPYFTMKLVKGVTLAQLLKERQDVGQVANLPKASTAGQRPAPHSDRPRFLKVFEQVCQTVAYAHTKGVIHRDLKPSNIMVGAFGEVQVMDWGLAKVLASRGRQPTEQTDAGGARPPPAVPSVVKVSRAEADPSASREGDVKGTPAYMPPEQALGEHDRLDERADVFSLGAILCEILTGRPPYVGESTQAVLRMARRADLTEALARLDTCSADAELLDLARRCLAAEPMARPRHASEVARAVEAYLAGVEERARQAELERAAAEARAAEAKATARAERRARRLTLGLAVAALLLVVGGGSGTWLLLARRQAADQKTQLTMERTRELLDAGWQANDVGQLTLALAEAEKAVEVAHGGAGGAAREEAEALRDEATAKLERAKKNAALLTALLDVTIPRETRQYARAESGTMMALAEPTLDEQFARAFERWGVKDINGTAVEDLAARLGAEPDRVVQEVVGGLDAWMLERRRTNRPEAEWRPLFELAERLDRNGQRRKLRPLLASGRLRTEWVADELSRVLLPWSAVLGPVTGEYRLQLRNLASQVQPEEPVLAVVALTRALREAGDDDTAEQRLRSALAAHPNEVALLDALGRLLAEQRRPRLGKAIECFRAARAVRPEMGISLAEALRRAGGTAEAEAILNNLIRRMPDNPEFHFSHGTVLHDQKKWAGAEAAFRKAIELKPDYAKAYNNLAIELSKQNKLKDAVAAHHKTIELRPDFPEAYTNLGVDLHNLKNWDEAIAAHRKAIELRPDYALAYNNLGTVLHDQKKWDEAIVAYRKAIALKPTLSGTHYNLGNALREQKKWDEAVASYRKAIALQPDYAEAYNHLGIAFRKQEKLGEAVAAYRKAIELQPDYAKAYYNLGIALVELNKLDEAIAAYRKAIALKPDDALAYNNLGIA